MLSIDPLIWIFLTTGFSVGFGHCIGMCGPIVISMSLNLKSQRAFYPLFLYNIGRTATYTFLGGIMGISGSFTMIASRMALIQKGVLIFAGVLIIILGLAMNGWLIRIPSIGSRSVKKGFIPRAYQWLVQTRSTAAYLPMGMVLGLLPCGPVYTALIASARAGMEADDITSGFFKGALLMFAFGAGTIPALLLVGRLAAAGKIRDRKIISHMGALMMVGIGIYFVIKGVLY